MVVYDASREEAFANVLILGKIASLAVFLFVVGCSGGGKQFEPAPGASINQAQLQGLIAQAMGSFNLGAGPFRSIDCGSSGTLHSCLEGSPGPCSVPGPPGLSVSYPVKEGMGVILVVKLADDQREVSHLVSQAEINQGQIATGVLRAGYEGTLGSNPLQSGRFFGPCDPKAERTTDKGSAWQDRSAPKVGDQAEAMKSETLKSHALSAVFFARADVYVDVEVAKNTEGAPNKLADDIAKAMDDQIKMALSQ